jgi:hypothetical protein
MYTKVHEPSRFPHLLCDELGLLVLWTLCVNDGAVYYIYI